jgi:lipopolysaccharide/colanic/teichoic acid biosynthesis glycosyltransferase/glycosyltransferase involved in cell wall biosynthesis
MKVLFLTQYYPPETGAAPARASHFAERLAGLGHDVTVVTGMPNHPSGVKQPAYRGRVFCRENREGVRIIRCFLYTSPRKSFARRILNQLSFAVTAVLGGLAAGRCEIVLVTSPPLFLGLTAWLIGIVRGVPYVLDLRDYWPRAAVALGQLTSPWAIAAAERLERFLYWRALKLVVVTPGMRRLLLDRGIAAHRMELIPNGADVERFVPVRHAPEGPENGEWDVLYAGTHGLVHGMDVILDAAHELRGETRIKFLIVGDGVAKPRLVTEARRRELSNIRFLPSQQPDQLVKLIQQADVCLATTIGGDFSASTVPVKVFDYMACGKPIVAAVGGDGRTVIERSRGGVVVEPGDGRALASAVVSLINDAERRRELGAHGREFVSREYSRAVLAEKMERILSECASREKVMCGSHLRFRHYLGAKYSLDAIGSLLLLVLSAPVFAALALLVKLDSRGRAVFTQRRIGVHSQEFRILKFRTMQERAPELATDLMENESIDYTTRFGRFLRKTSLDELPNLVNVLRGEMSLVGPRPALYNQYELIDMRRRVGVDLVRPGVTGWAQINGRDRITQGEKVRLDEFYVRNCSLLLDLRVFLSTFSSLRDLGS